MFIYVSGLDKKVLAPRVESAYMGFRALEARRCCDTVCERGGASPERSGKLAAERIETVEEYYSIVRRVLKLRPTGVATVFLDRDEMPHNIPRPEGYTPEERAAIIAKKKTQVPQDN